MTAMRQVVRLAIGLAIAFATAGMATAAPQQAYRLNDQQVRDLVERIDAHGKSFHDSYRRSIDRSRINGTSAEGQIDRAVQSFEQASNQLRKRANDRQSDRADAENVLRRAAGVDDLIRLHPLDATAQRDWQALRLDMDDLSRAYGLPGNWSAAAPSAPSRIDDRQIKQLLTGIGDKAKAFQKSLDQSVDRSRSADKRGTNQIRQSVGDLRQAADRLRGRVNGRDSNAVDVEDLLRRGASIDSFMDRNQLSTAAERDWLSLRGDLDRLARAYNVAWNWSNPAYVAGGAGMGIRQRLTGTYQLENDRSDDPRQAAELAVRTVPSDERQRTYQRIVARLQAPDVIAIERNQNSVTMASTEGERVTFEADGRDHSERWSADRTMNTRATLRGEQLVVATSGSRDSDFTVTFDPVEDGRGLQMTRTIDDERLRQPLTVRSSYRRLSDDARWTIDSAGARDAYGDRATDAGRFGVPDGTRMVARLDNALIVADARQGDLYTMTVRSPVSYEGAVIQGFVSSVDESARLGGRPGITLNLRSIRLQNGRSYQFDGLIEDVRTPDGKVVPVNREGTFSGEGDSQTHKAAQRGAIGAALGAIVGAVVGGGKGAAIGAVIGAGGGAGTVIFGGRDGSDLERGTEFTIVSGDASAPSRIPTAQR